jgi:hypothetical protein
MTDVTKVLLISPRFAGRTFLSLEAVCEVYGGRAMTAPLGLITVAAMLPGRGIAASSIATLRI